VKSQIIAGAVAIGLALGPGVANAAGDGGSSAGYSLGSGVAHVGDGSDPRYFTPRYSGGTGAAHVGDGSDPGYLDSEHYLQSAPGRGGGNG
jgi:hypothetical protein